MALVAPGALYGAVCAREPYAWSTGGELVASSDAGRSWHTVAIPPHVEDCPEVTTGQPAGGVEEQNSNQPLANLVCIATPLVLYAIGAAPVPRTFPYPLDNGFVPAELWRSDDGGRSWYPDGYTGASLVACTPAEVWSLTRIGPPGMGAETALFRTPGTATGRCLVERPPTSLPVSAGPCSSMVEEAGYWQSLVSMRSGTERCSARVTTFVRPKPHRARDHVGREALGQRSPSAWRRGRGGCGVVSLPTRGFPARP